MTFHGSEYQRFNKSTVKNLKGMTCSVSYCKHTSVKVAIGTSFHNIKNAKLKNILATTEHPVFNISPYDLLKVIESAKTPTEQYLVSISFLVNTGFLNTNNCGLNLDSLEVDKYYPHFINLIPLIMQFSREKEEGILKKKDRKDHDILPVYKVSTINCESGSQLKQYLKLLYSQIDSLLMGGMPIVKDEFMLDDEIALEQEIKKILSNYKVSHKLYSEKLGQWALRSISIHNDDVTPQQLKAFKYYLNAPVNKLREEVLRQIIKEIKDLLSYEDADRENSLLVIRHLEAKLETICDFNDKLGFITLEAEISKNEGALIQYETRTKVTDNFAVVVNRKPSGDSALERLRNKFKKG